METASHIRVNNIQQKKRTSVKIPDAAGPGFSAVKNLKGFLFEQRKIIEFDEGVFIFMLSLAIVLDQLIPMLWVFAASQLSMAFYRVGNAGTN